MMSNQNRKPYGYYPARYREPQVYREIDSTNKNVSRVAFGVGMLAVGGYFLCKKVKDLNARLSKLESGRKKDETER